ncbi:hypothetical protein SAMN06295885_0684 [Rathayibacter oskolensis]|uniref:Uncharacterized protein n=1 Tax=Rathayibacter oskolensis TaxID=1891671 RepID=A0A1X7N3X6_9MICO|nr:hypothetical protein [Rathayibacter oskolensis]SMH32066.1 hypothetical protein SAMN06295885_0684 [Rathayibacter oskolensis]
MAERNGHHCVGLRSRVRRTDSIRAGILSASVHSSDTRIRLHDITRLRAEDSKGAVIMTAPFFASAAESRGGVRQPGGQ